MPQRLTLPLFDDTNTSPWSRVLSRASFTNMYLRQDKRLPRFIAKSTPGLVEWSNPGGSEVRGMLVHSGKAYVVVDNTVYVYTDQFTKSTVGTISSNSGPIDMVATNDEILIVDGTQGQIITVSSDSIAAISDADFDDFAVQAAATNNYFLYLKPNSDQVYISDLNDGTSWSATAYKESDVKYDNNVSILVNNTIVWVLGETSTELWYDSGAETVPFDNASAGALSYGCAAARSPVVINNVVYWLAQDEHGLVGVVRSEGSQVDIISTEEINERISRFDAYSDAFSWSIKIDGHDWFVLSFPSAETKDGVQLGTSLVYDIKTGRWFDWKSLYDSAAINPDFTRHRANCHMFFKGDHVVGDFESGKLYKVDSDVYKDGDDIILRKIVSSHVDNRGGLIAVLGLELLIENAVADATTTDPQLMIRYSKDYGKTWSDTLFRSAGKVGEYDKEVRVNSCGTGRSFTLEISATDPVPWTILEATAKVIPEK